MFHQPETPPKEPEMPNRQIADNTAEVVAGRETIDNVIATIATFSEITLSDRREAWTARLAELIAEVHELAHMENERRWAAALDLNHSENADAIRDLAVRVRRNYRLSREPGRELMSRYSRWCSNAQRELREEHGFEVDNLHGVWSIEPVRSGDDYC